MVRCGSLRAVRFGTVRRGQSWLGGCVKARCGNVRRGSVWFGKAVAARPDKAGWVKLRLGGFGELC